MRLFDSFGGPDLQPPDGGPDMALRQVIVQSRLNRVLAFTRLTIDDVVNNPIAKNQVLGYYKLSKMIDRRGEIVELERQWNATGVG